MELHVELRRLAQGGGDAANFRDLRTDVEMNEFQAVVHAHFVERLQGLQQFGRVEAELGGVAAALLPLARARRGELDAYAEVGAHAEFLRGAGNAYEFGHLFDDEEHALAHFLCQERKFYKVLVFVAVADNQAVAVHVRGQHGVQFGFAAGFEAEVVLLAVADNLFNHGAHLVYLNRVDDKVVGFVVVLLFGAVEAFCGLLDAVVKDIGEAQQDGRGDVARVEFVNYFLEVYFHAVFAR